MLYKTLEFVKLFVPLKALFTGFKGGFPIGAPLILNVSFTAIPESPSQARKPILASLLSITFKLFRVILISSGTACIPS